MCLYLYVNIRYSCQILMKFEISRQIFVKSSNIKFHENPSSGNPVVPCGGKDRHYGANSRFPKFCERAQKMGGGLVVPPTIVACAGG